MKLTAFNFFFFCCGFSSSVIAPASGKPLQTGSPGPVYAAAGGDVVLPCGLTTSAELSRIVTVEWSRVDGQNLLTVHVVRGGEELVKEKAPEYLRRTAVLGDGSLKLLGVQQRDNGTYRCVLLRGSHVENQVFVSLFVAQGSEVNLSVRRTSTNQLLVQCESSGWIPEPQVSLLDSSRTVLAARTESSVQPDHLYSVSALADVAAAGGNGTLTCRVEIPGTSLSHESKIHISDEFDPQNHDGLGHYLTPAVVLLLFCVAIVVFVVPLRIIEKLRSAPQRLIASCIALNTQQRGRQEEDQLLLGEYGDISRVETTGASDDTAKANQLFGSGARGVEVSKKLAERDLQDMLKYKETILSVGNALGVPPALIAAIISRQSQAGTTLSADGYGDIDRNCYGLMQINKQYHAVKGNPFSRDHVDQGVTFFIQLIKTMKRTKPDWTKEQQLKGALACYISGEELVIPLTYEELDSVTPYGDFANDVVARAQWFALKDF